LVGLGTAGGSFLVLLVSGDESSASKRLPDNDDGDGDASGGGETEHSEATPAPTSSFVFVGAAGSCEKFPSYVNGADPCLSKGTRY